MLSQRLQEFLTTWCNPETEPEYTAGMLGGPGGAYYRDWLPQELLTAVRSRELNPQTMGALADLGFTDQAGVDEWLRSVWPLWFTGPFPGLTS